MTDETDTDDKKECPVCGGEYDYKRTETTGQVGGECDLRADATQCKSREIDHTRTYYVHR